MIAENRAQLRQTQKQENRRKFRQRLNYAIGPTIMLAMGVTVIASAQSSSPFASQKKVQAWEQPQNSVAMAESDAEQQARQSASRLQLRTRTLDADSATAPPPGAVEPPAPKPTPAPVQRPRPKPSADVAASAPSAPPSRVAEQTQSSPPLNAPPLTAPPLNAPPLAANANQQGYETRSYGSIEEYRAQSPSYNQYANRAAPDMRSATGGSYQSGGAYGQMPRGSVNNPPSRSVDNQTDWTVHDLAGRPPAPYGPYGAPHPGDWEDHAWTGSNKPTASDFGYSRQVQPETYAQAQRQPQPYSSGQSSPPLDAPPPDPYGQPYPQTYPSQGPYSAPPGYDQRPYPPRRQGFFQRIGLGAISSFITGTFRAGAAARENNDWEEAFIGDGDVEVEFAAITQGGLEWGVHGQVRAQYDELRKGFTRRLPDCPPNEAGCASLTLPGLAGPASVRGHTTQFYTDGPDVAEDAQIAVESAHLFLRSAYGDVTLGRDDGAAFLFSLGAPSLLNVSASNSPTDYTGLDAVKTVNDASGFSEKVTYTSPRLLGDQVGLGVQFGASYSPRSRGCGVDYCVDLNDIPNVVAPDIQDVFEVGVALDRNFAPGMSVELTGTYASGSENSGLAGLDDLSAYGAGLEFRVRDFTLGGSYLKSNQGLLNGDYESYDAGVTWKPSRLGFTLGYGHATDDNVSLKSDQITGGVTFDVNDSLRLGVGAQYADRETLRLIGGNAQPENDKATALFVEGRFTF
jgi:hypothetical protein